MPSQQFAILFGGRRRGSAGHYATSAEDKKKYSKVIDEFDKHFKAKKNVVFERARFNQRSQFADEPADHFITEIH